MKKIQRIDALFEFLRIVLGLIIAYIVAIGFIYLATGSEALEAVYNFMLGPITNNRRFGQFMAKFIPYLLTGSAFCFIYSAGRFSLIAEGIINFAPIIACLFMFKGGFMTNLPLIVNLIIMLFICAVVGGLVAMVPAYVREKLNQSEMVFSIIMNYMLLYLAMWLLKSHLLDRSVSMQTTEPFPDNMRFHSLIGTTNFHSGIFVAIIGWIVALIIYDHTKIGEKIRICGGNPSFAKYSGINVAKTVFIAQIIGGIFAGLAACVDCFGMYNRYMYGGLTNVGMDGLLVAVMAQKKPKYVPFAAVILAYIRTSAVILNVTSSLPVEFVNMMQAVLIFFVAAEQFLAKQKYKAIYNVATKEAELKAKEESK